MGKDNCEICGPTMLHCFRFPKKRFQKWAKFARVSKERLNSKHCFLLCEKHFREDDFLYTYLQVRIKPGRDPSLCRKITAEDEESEPEDVRLFEDDIHLESYDPLADPLLCARTSNDRPKTEKAKNRRKIKGPSRTNDDVSYFFEVFAFTQPVDDKISIHSFNDTILFYL